MTAKNVRNEKQNLFLCMGESCVKKKSEKTLKTLKKSIKKAGLEDKITIIKTQCTKHCDDGPMLFVERDAVSYKKVSPKAAEKIVAGHLVEGKAVKKYLMK